MLAKMHRATPRTDLCDTGAVKGSEFLRKLPRLPRRRGVRFQYEPGLGKGSHGRVWLESGSSTLKDPKKELAPLSSQTRPWLESGSSTLKVPKKELGTGLLRDMCRDLGIEPRDL